MLLRLLTKEEVAPWHRKLLPECFEPHEIKPFSDIERLLAQERYEIWGAFAFEEKQAGGEACLQGLCGFATIWKRQGIPLVLVDYLGVRPGMRGRGLGAWMLSELKKQGRPAVLESEMPAGDASQEENDVRERRIAFYERCGFTPSYEMATCGLRFLALHCGCEDFDMRDIMRWHKALYDEKRSDVLVPIGADEMPLPPYWMT